MHVKNKKINKNRSYGRIKIKRKKRKRQYTSLNFKLRIEVMTKYVRTSYYNNFNWRFLEADYYSPVSII